MFLLTICLVFFIHHSSNHCAAAWKPIIGGSPPSPATIYSLHQAHSSSSDLNTHHIKTSHHSINTLGSLGEIPLSSLSDSSFEGFDHSLTFAATDADDDSFGYKYSEARDFTAAGILGGGGGEDPCAVKKYAFNHDGVVKYNNKIPELDQFTLCYWMRFTNHSGDHVMLTYATEKEKRQVQLWVANSKNSSFLSMAIKGQQLYRLNIPLKTRKWHHTCTSWNGKTGEWQVWLKAERVGRGFHNSLVGYKIQPNGKMFSGGPSVTGELSQGLHFEMTLLQIYRVALSAGKAHRDHKHHHVHHFDHEGLELSTTTLPPPRINRPQPMHHQLASGQIPTQVRINLAQPQEAGQLQLPPGLNPNLVGTAAPPPQNQALTINTNFINGQFHTGSRLITQQLIGQPAGPRGPTQRPQITQTTQTQAFNMLNNPANVQFIDETETRLLFKRQAAKFDLKIEEKSHDDDVTDTKAHSKRELVLLNDGRIVDDANGDLDPYIFDGLAEFGGQKFKHELNVKMNIEDEIKEHDREPAEEEVKAVMALCGSCDVEPFLGAIVFAWKDAKAELDNALKGSSVGSCGNF